MIKGIKVFINSPARWYSAGLVLVSGLLFAQPAPKGSVKPSKTIADFASMTKPTAEKRAEWELEQGRSVLEAERGAVQSGEIGRASFARAALQLQPLVAPGSFRAKTSTHELEGLLLRDRGQWVVITVQHKLDSHGHRTGDTALFLNRRPLLSMPEVKIQQASNIESQQIVEDKEISTMVGDHAAEIKETQFWSRRRSMAAPSAPVGEFKVKPVQGDSFVMSLVQPEGPTLEGASFGILTMLRMIPENMPIPEYFGFTLFERPSDLKTYLERFDRSTGDLFRLFLGAVRTPKQIQEIPLILPDRQVTAFMDREGVRRVGALFPHGKNSSGEYRNDWLIVYTYSIRGGLDIGLIHVSGCKALIKKDEIQWDLPKPKNKLSYDMQASFMDLVNQDYRFIRLEGEKKKLGTDRNKISRFDDQHMHEYDQIFKDARALEHSFVTPLDPESIRIRESFETLGEMEIELSLPSILASIQRSSNADAEIMMVKIEFTEFPQLLKGIKP